MTNITTIKPIPKAIKIVRLIGEKEETIRFTLHSENPCFELHSFHNFKLCSSLLKFNAKRDNSEYYHHYGLNLRFVKSIDFLY